MSRRKSKRSGYSERLSFGVTPEQKRRLEELLRVRAKVGKAEHLTDLLREALNLYLAKQDDIPGTKAAITRRLEGRMDAVEEQLARQFELLNRLLAFFQKKRDGNGLYFAPCVRREQKGTAENAAIATALWVDIDCDDDEHQREKALQKLEYFKPKSSLIVESGGGWHGYWLLDEPYRLESDKQRQHISLILQGLFAALEGYVKSVAAMRRLPGSTNTKPERGGGICPVKQKLFELD